MYSLHLEYLFMSVLTPWSPRWCDGIIHHSACFPETAAWNNKFHWKAVMRYEWVTLSWAEVSAEGREWGGGGGGRISYIDDYHLIAAATRWRRTNRNTCFYGNLLMIIYWAWPGCVIISSNGKWVLRSCGSPRIKVLAQVFRAYPLCKLGKMDLQGLNERG